MPRGCLGENAGLTINISPLTRRVKCINNNVISLDRGHCDAAPVVVVVVGTNQIKGFQLHR